MPDEVVVPYDWKKSLEKAGWDMLHSIVAVAGTAVAVYLSDPAHWQVLVQALPAQWAIPFGLGISAAAAYFRNWLKHA